VLVAIVFSEATLLDGFTELVRQRHDIALLVNVVGQARTVEMDQDTLPIIRTFGRD